MKNCFSGRTISRAALLNLPDEVLEIILRSIGPQYFCVRLVCKRLSALVSSQVSELNVAQRLLDQPTDSEHRRLRNTQFLLLPKAFPQVKRLVFDYVGNLKAVNIFLLRAATSWKLDTVRLDSALYQARLTANPEYPGVLEAQLLRTIVAKHPGLLSLKIFLNLNPSNLELLGQLTQLVSLDCTISNSSAVSNLAGWPVSQVNLQTVALEFLRPYVVSASCPVFQLHNLASLALRPVTFKQPEDLKALEQLKLLSCLNLHAQLGFSTDVALAIISRLTTVQHLALEVWESVELPPVGLETHNVTTKAPSADHAWRVLQHLPQLISLEVVLDNLEWDIGASTACFNKLTRLSIWASGKGHTNCSALPPLPKLQSLAIKFHHPMAEQSQPERLVQSLSKVTSLRSLEVVTWFPNSSLWAALGALTHLKSLDMDCYFIGSRNKGLAIMTKKMKLAGVEVKLRQNYTLCEFWNRAKPINYEFGWV